MAVTGWNFHCCHVKTGFRRVRRDALYRLSLKGLTQLEKAPWLAPPEKVELCQNKGQAETSCHNFVKVLLASGKRVFTCGTNAFSPQCSWREVSVLTNIQRDVTPCRFRI